MLRAGVLCSIDPFSRHLGKTWANIWHSAFRGHAAFFIYSSGSGGHGAAPGAASAFLLLPYCARKDIVWCRAEFMVENVLSWTTFFYWFFRSQQFAGRCSGRPSCRARAFSVCNASRHKLYGLVWCFVEKTRFFHLLSAWRRCAAASRFPPAGFSLSWRRNAGAGSGKVRRLRRTSLCLHLILGYMNRTGQSKAAGLRIL